MGSPRRLPCPPRNLSGNAAGARGYVLKTDTNGHLIAAIEALGRREAYISGKLSADLLVTLVAPREGEPRELLTPRERAAVQLIAEGNTNKSAAQVLGIKDSREPPGIGGPHARSVPRQTWCAMQSAIASCKADLRVSRTQRHNQTS